MAAIAMEQQHSIGKTFGQRRIMQRGDDACALSAQLAELRQDFDLMVRVEMIARLIEQIDLRCLRQQCGHRRASLLAARERRDQRASRRP